MFSNLSMKLYDYQRANVNLVLVQIVGFMCIHFTLVLLSIVVRSSVTESKFLINVLGYTSKI
jgi:hypothetical protein